MDYTWLGEEAKIVVEERRPGAYDILIDTGEKGYAVAGMEKQEDGTFVAFASGTFYKGKTIEEAARPAVDLKHREAADRLESKNRINESAAERKKRKQEEQERQEAFN